MKKKLELFHEKVLKDRNAYLIIELIQDIHEVSFENGLQDALIKHSHLLIKVFPKNSRILCGFILFSKNRLLNAEKLIYLNTPLLH